MVQSEASMKYSLNFLWSSLRAKKHFLRVKNIPSYNLGLLPEALIQLLTSLSWVVCLQPVLGCTGLSTVRRIWWASCKYFTLLVYNVRNYFREKAPQRRALLPLTDGPQHEAMYVAINYFSTIEGSQRCTAHRRGRGNFSRPKNLKEYCATET